MTKSADIEQTMAEIVDPWLGVSLKTAKVLKTVQIEDNAVSVKIKLGYPADAGVREHYQTSLSDCLNQLNPDYKLNLDLSVKISAHVVQASLKAVPGVKNIIAVGSGKGGVGKSTSGLNGPSKSQQAGAIWSN